MLDICWGHEHVISLKASGYKTPFTKTELSVTGKDWPTEINSRMMDSLTSGLFSWSLREKTCLFHAKNNLALRAILVLSIATSSFSLRLDFVKRRQAGVYPPCGLSYRQRTQLGFHSFINSIQVALSTEPGLAKANRGLAKDFIRVPPLNTNRPASYLWAQPRLK